MSKISESVVLCDGTLIPYTVGDNMYWSALYEGEYDGFVKVNSCDGSVRKASGEFDLILDDGDGNELALQEPLKTSAPW